MDWEDEFRPKKFRHVRAQPQAVKQMSGRIIRRLHPRPLLLTGAVGSGKTTLIRLFARGLNCASVEFDGSPCGECEFCSDPSQYLVEWDTTGRGGELGHVAGLVQKKFLAFGRTKYTVFFFDECHALKPEAQDALLKSIEDAPPGVAFCFATTEGNRIKHALLSRLHEVRIYPISAGDAYLYLAWIARRKKVAFDPEGLHLLVAAKPPYLRDLIIGLQELAELGQRITADLVKEKLGLQVCDHLSAYVRGLALGDRSKQIQAMQDWPDDIVEKRIWIEKFISSAYYNDVLGLEYVVDPMVHALAITRREFVQSLQNRFQLDVDGLKVAFEAMMKFWSRHALLTDNSAYLTLGLFEAMVDDGFRKPSLSDQKNNPRPERAGTNIVEPTKQIAVPTVGSRSSYLSLSEAREIVNVASFFAQDSGTYLNALIMLVFKGMPDLEGSAERALKHLIQMLDRGCQNHADPLAAFGALEREQHMIVARVLAYVDVKRQVDLVQSCAAWSKPGARVVDIKFSTKARDNSFQWGAVRDICASCDEADANGATLRSMLRIPRVSWRTSGPLRCERLHFSEGLNGQAIERANFPAVEPLSAFNARAIKWVDSGWEVKEASDRRREKAARRRDLQALQTLWEDDPNRLKAEQAKLLNSWREIAPEQRSRRWRGWW
jgi:DNA polymerase-3 subunit gamma/tau